MHAKRYALAFLLSGLALAEATPAYVAFAVPDLAGLLLHPELFLLQVAPYAVCGALWLPRRTPGAGRTALVLALILFIAALIIYVPILWAPAMLRGDMAGLFYAFVAVATTIGVLLASAAVALLLRVYPPPRRMTQRL